MSKKVAVDKATERAMKKLGELITECRGRRSLRKIAEPSGIAASQLQSIERGILAPTADIYPKLLDTLQPDEKQKSEKDSGQLSIYYESEIDCRTLIESQKYDLMYMSQKEGVYETHDYKKNNIRENLAEELEPLLSENHPTKDTLTVKKVAYYYAGKMIEKYRNTGKKKDAMALLSKCEKIDSRRYGIIINIFEDESPIKQEDKIFVKSIDYIKGMEGEKCLFILTNDTYCRRRKYSLGRIRKLRFYYKRAYDVFNMDW